jgi:hypothetical protein
MISAQLDFKNDNFLTEMYSVIITLPTLASLGDVIQIEIIILHICADLKAQAGQGKQCGGRHFSMKF